MFTTSSKEVNKSQVANFLLGFSQAQGCDAFVQFANQQESHATSGSQSQFAASSAEDQEVQK